MISAKLNELGSHNVKTLLKEAINVQLQELIKTIDEENCLSIVMNNNYELITILNDGSRLLSRVTNKLGKAVKKAIKYHEDNLLKFNMHQSSDEEFIAELFYLFKTITKRNFRLNYIAADEILNVNSLDGIRQFINHVKENGVRSKSAMGSHLGNGTVHKIIRKNDHLVDIKVLKLPQIAVLLGDIFTYYNERVCIKDDHLDTFNMRRQMTTQMKHSLVDAFITSQDKKIIAKLLKDKYSKVELLDDLIRKDNEEFDFIIELTDGNSILNEIPKNTAFFHKDRKILRDVLSNRRHHNNTLLESKQLSNHVLNEILPESLLHKICDKLDLSQQICKDAEIVTAVAGIINVNGKYILQKHKKAKDMLVFPSGKLDGDHINLSINELLEVELLEEINIDIRNLNRKFIKTKLVETNRTDNIKCMNMNYIYVEAFNGEIKNMEPEKHSELLYLDIFEVSRYYDLGLVPEDVFEVILETEGLILNNRLSHSKKV